MHTVLVVDDEKPIREALKQILEYEHFETLLAEDGTQCLRTIERHAVDAVLLDIKMPGMDGLETLIEIKRRQPELPVIMISGHGTIETAVEASRKGSFDFLEKPPDRDRILITLRNALAQRSLEREVKTIREQMVGRDRILGNSPLIRSILELIERVGPTDSRVLITGENGTGKELVARAIHESSKRRDKPMVEVNCAAIPTELIESELFGHEKGSFTGATVQRIGKFEQADGSTIFLDEVGDMSLAAQAKVLRVLEEGKIERVGGSKLITVNVRVVAATNKNLGEEIKKGHFREDLYHRLNVIPIHVPPLRDRRSDIPMLAEAFINEVCKRNGIAPKQISERALRILSSHEWSGNVRELRNMIERLVILSPSKTVDESLLESSHTLGAGTIEDIIATSGNFQEFQDRAEAAFIKHMLDRHGWNVSKTAEAIDIQRSHLYSKLKKFGLERGGKEG